MRRFCSILILSLALAGCGTAAAPLAGVRGPASVAARASAPSYPTPHLSANRTEVYYDMATFEAMERLVAGAKKSIALDYYIFGGPTASRLADLLIEKHKAGLDVRVLLDSALGTVATIRKDTRPVYEKLKAAGVPLAFHSTAPIPPLTEGKTIDHNKYFVVDGTVALVGSMNIARKFYQYHDLMIRAEGPVAEDLTRQFDFDWYRAHHPEAKAPEPVHAALLDGPVPGPTEASQVRLVGTGAGRQTGFEALMPLLEHARKSIHVQMHELGDERVLTALEAARDRGVDVRILLDPGVIDPFVPVIHKGPRGIVNAVAVDRLLKKHMNVRTYKVDEQFNTAHMKCAVIDGEILFAGSINWTRGGFEWVSETALEVRGGQAPAQAERQFEHDWIQRGIPAEPPSALALALCKLYNRL